jgi:hypothetical protein
MFPGKSVALCSVRLFLIALVPLLTTRFVSAESSEAPVQISFGELAVQASGITRGGDAIVFAATIGRYSGMQKLGRHAKVVADDDSDGAITLTVDELPVPSVWAVVDLQSGRYAVAAPAGFALRTMDLPSHGWRGGLQRVDFRRDYLEVLVVRPGAGAWTLRVSEGGANDDDGALNAVLRTRLARMQRLYGEDAAPRPPVVIPKDLLLIIDPHELDYFVVEAQ